MQEARFHLNSVPLLCLGDPDNCRGTVLVYHGLTAGKDTQEKELRSLAQRGFLAIGVDAVGHGERRFLDLESRLEGPDYHLEFLQMVRSTVAEIPPLVSQLRERFPRAGRFGLTGISMGGYIAFAAAVNQEYLEAVAPILGSPDWAARSPLPLPSELFQESPHHTPEWFNPTALLIQNAGRDEHVDPRPAREFVREARTYYAAYPERIAYYEYPDSGHFMKEEDWNALWERTVGWFERFL